MIGLSDRQLAIVMEAAKPLSLEKRSIFMQRLDAMLRHRRAGRGFNDDERCRCRWPCSCRLDAARQYYCGVIS